LKKSIIVILLVILLISTMLSAGTKEKNNKNKPKPLVTFVELGSVSCIPCKMMKPVMAEVEKEYGDKILVVFHDVNKDRQKASDYKIRVIPTQVFLNKKGKEFYRHEGFFPKDELMKIVDKQLGINRAEKK
jgi:thioredoxin 1